MQRKYRCMEGLFKLAENEYGSLCTFTIDGDEFKGKGEVEIMGTKREYEIIGKQGKKEK